MDQPYRDEQLERPMPSNPEAERYILGSIFLDNSLIAEAMELLEPDDYYVPSNKKTWKAMVSCFMVGSEINPMTVGHELEKEGQLEAAGGYLFLTNLTNGLPHVTSIASYAEIIKGKSVLRRLLKEAARITSDVLEQDDEPSGVLDRAGKGIFNITLEHTPQNFKKLHTITHTNLQKAYEVQQSGHSITGVPTGLTEIDSLMLGLQPTDLIVLAARPSVGKTALSVQIADYAAIEGDYTVAFFSLEMGEEQIGDRFLCLRARMDGLRFRGGSINPEEWDRLNAAHQDFQQGNVFIDETPGISTMKIKAKCRRLFAEQGKLDLVIIDYIQLIGNDGTRNHYSREQEVAQISKDLKGLAKEMKIPVLVLSQLNRGPENRTDHRPNLSDLRESGAVEQDADAVIFIYRGDMYKPADVEKDNLAEMILAKQRKGPRGTKLVRFDDVSGRFDNLAHHEH